MVSPLEPHKLMCVHSFSSSFLFDFIAIYCRNLNMIRSIKITIGAECRNKQQ